MDNIFETKVQKQIERLKEGEYGRIERDVAEKRTAWFKQNQTQSISGAQPSPRTAFNLLFFEYMGLSPKDLTVIRENENEIIWRSLNPCPTLEACWRLGLDTRLVCRAAYERSTQALISLLDPQLRFLRSYVEIRPYQDYCLESLTRINFEAMVGLAVKTAQDSIKNRHNDEAAIVAMGNRILSKTSAPAASSTNGGPSACEIAMQEAIRSLGDPHLSGAILFSPFQPGEGIYRLAKQHHLSAIVFGCSKAQPESGEQQDLQDNRENNTHLAVESIGGVLLQQCLELLKA